MKVTSIKVNNMTPSDRGICAEFTIVLDNAICIHKIYVVNGEKGLFIAFPNTGEMKMYKNSKRYVDIVHPTNNTIRDMIEYEILERYKKELAKGVS